MLLRGRLALLAALLTGVGLAACGTDDPASTTTTPATSTTSSTPPTTPATGSGPTESSTTAPAVEVPEYLDFVAPDVRGGQVIGAELAGQDLVIWFWAPW